MQKTAVLYDPESDYLWAAFILLSISWSPLDPCFYPNVHECFVFQEPLGWRMLVEACHNSLLLFIFLTYPKYVPCAEGKGYLHLLFHTGAFQIRVSRIWKLNNKCFQTICFTYLFSYCFEIALKTPPNPSIKILISVYLDVSTIVI